MKLFTGIDARRGDQTIGAAFRIIGKRVKALPPPRSLCEVGADSEDSHWLCTWAWSLQPQTALKWLTEYRRGAGDNAPVALSQVIGSLFLFLAAEAARREAREGYVWPAVHEKFQSETRRLLFAQGQPTQLYKEAIEVAAHLLKLRHVFGLEGTQNYYVSIYIQFGFTQKGLAQLPFWLAGHVQIGVAGAARFTEGGWETLNPRGELTVQDAQTYTYKLFLPSLWVGERLQELALLEGSTYSRRLWQKPQPLGKLAGFGAPLVIRGPYNWTENTDVLTLARAVVAPGVVGEVEREEDCLLRIHLRLPIEPGSQHQVVCWSEGDRPDLLPPECISVLEQTCWQVNYRPSNPSQLIVAVAYAGARLGAWWSARLDDVLNPPIAVLSSPTTTAALLRWMHLPILSPSFLPAISAFARHHPAETLAAWLLDKGLPEALSFAAIGEEWVAAVRQVFANWFPEPEQTQAIVKTLSMDSVAQPLWTAARWLMRVDPLLMGRVVRSWFKDADSSSRGQGSAAACANLPRA